ncbi:MAG: autotransporter outer membrane beta-barrel domain-containing protein, partial [Puniceicoccales bacterium]|nr:autotransporter outer membrane beta-barrel domain-containing protein [Puniceicoccales bacterium]MDR2862363.1 autotransporter outer membrane beta-barrel domain-containing protein [Puniceicoccales bacterium]
GTDGSTESVSGGLYAAWLHRAGWYVDGAFKAQYFDSKYDTVGDGGKFTAYGFGFELEAGRQIEIASSWFVEPSIHAAYTHIFTEGYTSRRGLRVSNEDSDVFRIGASARLGRTFDLGGHGQLQPYLSIGVDWMTSSGGSVRVSDVSLRPNVDGARVRGGLGTIWQLSSRDQVYFDYEAALGEKYNVPWSVNIGYRRRF